ncbi:MAG: flagellar basal-body rod protein FlgG [Ignavibacteriota bacterium]|jgi:flagellar basal-body rod protein FlgG|nr:MAG: flagellar basal-body rod protein FlgG [Ignavibacterium sp.]MBL1153667.1 flagellar basal-body rod protein FlgG [Ignavibacteriota bacterium]MCO6448201.1 flagellar basal-body rod protein FlgG [Ignavibacterium album]MCZ2267985.1 flagellar basal-body rod protein FlgG [Ignavibacteriales bacterium]MDX9711413.1 flagellar basal-body rod protein FlgG [Ignavibacteriaceae bacterium]
MSNRALRTAASGMYAQQLNVEVISNNMANMNTTAFKKNRAEFQDLMYQEVVINTVNSTTPGDRNSGTGIIQVGNGVKPASTQKSFLQGDITATSNPLDVAIQGEGFFQVRKVDGTILYTRDGSFKLNAEGNLVTAGGYLLDPEISLDESSVGVIIGRDGTVELQQSDGNRFPVGNIQLVRFLNPGGLLALGDNLYGETPESGRPILGNPGFDDFGEIHQGYLEASNVDIVEEMVSMITAQRAYELNSKTVKTVEDMMTMANNLKR